MKIYSIIISVVIFLSVCILCSYAITQQFNERINNKVVLNSDCSQGYTYIEVVENGEIWIYVYCGDVFVIKYREVDR